ncbi:hypothetical protein HPP92_016919 [Vanilla planifolia]|uniref:Uncharacterized protein n=1 Tax=Vanilla planifolia TaxID=51239 RepID=A0A835QIG4_VANPL|nr:hypothetical protein HPP92_016919 [Vanilla planifolia]
MCRSDLISHARGSIEPRLCRVDQPSGWWCAIASIALVGATTRRRVGRAARDEVKVWKARPLLHDDRTCHVDQRCLKTVVVVKQTKLTGTANNAGFTSDWKGFSCGAVDSSTSSTAAFSKSSQSVSQMTHGCRDLVEVPKDNPDFLQGKD